MAAEITKVSCKSGINMETMKIDEAAKKLEFVTVQEQARLYISEPIWVQTMLYHQVTVLCACVHRF